MESKRLLTENLATEQLSALLEPLISELESQFNLQDLNLFKPIESGGWSRSGRLTLKELPGWLFGFELELNTSSITFFGEHRWLIDKFKPSRCYVSYESLAVDNFAEVFQPALSELKDIQAFPIRHFGRSLYFGDEISDEEAFKEYEQMKFERRYQKRLDKTLTKQFFDYCKTLPIDHPGIEAVGVIDYHKELQGARIYPRYAMRLLVRPETSDEVVQTLYALLEVLISTGVFKGERMQVKLDGIYDSKQDLKKCHYVYQ